MQQLVQRARIDAGNRLGFRDEPFLGQIDCNPKRRLGRASCRAGLQHPQFALLDGEAELHHVHIVCFEPFTDGKEVVKNLGHQFLHAR